MILEPPAGAPRLSLRWVCGGTARDVVGHLVAANEQWYVLLPEDRPAVWVPRAEAAGVRRVPERSVLPVSRPEDLERALEQARPGVRRARLGGWRVSGHGVLAVGDPGAALDDALQAAEAWIGGSAPVRTLRGSTEALTALGLSICGGFAILTADGPSSSLAGAVPLTRGWALEVHIGDLAGLEAAAAAGFVERYRAVILTRP
ncbi:hypothetical protein H5398_05580 [Tessaracoccus sp. MC1679]|uniref:hypothetical protein n=1 Tax=Tessaracoccus sp. MC1679 TaxID=2760313 RepID=UPI00160256CB|nr:hypothetical protein [Tessaracoccus sp. MC1679]MBB1515450.1 hypothetical protein [Tessaracoccus sp. MC1679]